MVLSSEVNFQRFQSVMRVLLIALVLPGCDPRGEPPPDGPSQGKSSEPRLSAVTGHGGGVTPACADNDAIDPDTVAGSRRAQARAYTADTTFFSGPGRSENQQNPGNVEPENERLDCQSLIVSRDGKLLYDSLMTVWAFRALGDANFPQPKAVAGIYYQGAGPYGPLRINRGRNCVFLEGDPKGSLTAYVMPVSGSNKCNNFDPGNAVKRGVFKMPNAHPGGPQKVARIIDTGGDYYIGLQCGKFWCVIGGDVGAAPPSAGLPSGGGDEQRLGYVVGGVLRPSDLVGTLMPTFELFARKNASDYSGGFVTIAFIQFTDAGPTAGAARKYYADKWQLPGGILPDLIEVKMRHNGSDFILKYGGGPEKTAKYVSLPGHSLRGIVRWRWLDTDETSWFQCPFGCCSPD
jgi:hypothetical protein